jgi:hypothetical protein
MKMLTAVGEEQTEEEHRRLAGLVGEEIQPTRQGHRK